jgi:hypothetical protein
LRSIVKPAFTLQVRAALPFSQNCYLTSSNTQAANTPFAAQPLLRLQAYGRITPAAQSRSLAANQAIIEIAEALMRNASLPANAVGDALHIAFALEHRCDYLLTWNYRHLANGNIQRAVQRTLSTHSKLPSICTPEDLMTQSDENK